MLAGLIAPSLFDLRLRKEPLQCANPIGHTRSFLCLRKNLGENEGTIPPQSVIAMLAFSQDFVCRVPRREQAFHFRITCALCGHSSSVNVVCSFDARKIRFSSRNPCCGHMFVGRISQRKGKQGTNSATNPDISERCSAGASPTRRKIARALLSVEGQLGRTDAPFLRSWMTTTGGIRDGVAERMRAIRCVSL
jgi:hypothetical protein